MFTQFEDKGKIFTNVVTKRPVSVHIQTIHHLICGKFHIKPDERLKDELNQNETFVAVTDAMVFDLDGKLIHRSSFLAVNRSHVIWLYQDEESNDLREDE